MSATKTAPTSVSASVQAELDKIETKSGKIRYLATKGLTRYGISKVLGIRYQHVRNVLITPVRNPKA